MEVSNESLKANAETSTDVYNTQLYNINYKLKLNKDFMIQQTDRWFYPDTVTMKQYGKK